MDIIQSDIIGPLLTLAQDPIPNIRFNVAKCLEVLGTSYSTEGSGRAFVVQRIIPALEQQKTDSDADVRYFATRALQKTAEKAWCVSFESCVFPFAYYVRRYKDRRGIGLNFHDIGCRRHVYWNEST